MTSPRKSPPAQVVAALGSLRLTVTLLAMSIFLVFVGTLAQVEKGIWTVMEQYFRCWFAWVELKIFFARDANIGGGFPFPGGRLLGAALLTNLLVSHASRISVKARGPRLAVGIATLAVGLSITWVVISHVFDADSTQTGADPSGRVTMQLIYGGVSGAVLFVGCWLLFQRKAGIVLLHTGVVILMLSELVTSLLAKEAQMSIFEGQKINYVEDTRSVELALVDGSDPSTDDVYVIPERRLRSTGLIKVDGLPIIVETDEKNFIKNASLTAAKAGETNKATQGAGLRWLAVDRPESSGVDTSGSVDLPAVYVRLKDANNENKRLLRCRCGDGEGGRQSLQNVTPVRADL